eukprot:UN0892
MLRWAAPQTVPSSLPVSPHVGVLQLVAVVEHVVPLAVEPSVPDPQEQPFRSPSVGPGRSPEDLMHVEERGREVRPVAHRENFVQPIRLRVLPARVVPVWRLPLRAIVRPEEADVVHHGVASEPLEDEGDVDVADHGRVVLRQVQQRRHPLPLGQEFKDPAEHFGLMRPLGVPEDGHLRLELLSIPLLKFE